MRAGWIIACLVGWGAACSSFDGSPATTTTNDDGGTVADGAAPIDDSAGPVADSGSDSTAPPPNCFAVDPTARVCFDFDTNVPLADREVGNATLDDEAADAGGNALVATVNPGLAAPDTAHAYYHVGIEGNPSNPGVVHWKFDVRLDSAALHGVYFMQLAAGGPGGACYLQPYLTSDSNFRIVESCGILADGGKVNDVPLVDIGVQKTGWWNVDITIDFPNKKASATLRDPGGMTHPGQGMLLNATNQASLQLEMGVSFAEDNAKGAVYAFDNVFLYY